MTWTLKKFQDLSVFELYSILKARVDIFVVEQSCAYPEIDNYDQQAMHLFLKSNENLIAYVRILPKHTKYNEVSIGRVLVLKDYRFQGYATKIMQKAIHYIINEWQEQTIKIQAQHHLKNFYSSLGFKQISDVYLDDNIPHIDMILTK
ncbi:MAG TPA: GNAT family N-acetyltransferase [Pseudogracilibacillus sp.]|nr:GNAT family N-acetyltransferase [Pseudogracilibacillus sp.]